MIRNHLVKEKDYQRKDQQLGKRKKKKDGGVSESQGKEFRKKGGDKIRTEFCAGKPDGDAPTCLEAGDRCLNSVNIYDYEDYGKVPSRAHCAQCPLEGMHRVGTRQRKGRELFTGSSI